MRENTKTIDDRVNVIIDPIFDIARIIKKEGYKIGSVHGVMTGLDSDDIKGIWKKKYSKLDKHP